MFAFNEMTPALKEEWRRVRDRRYVTIRSYAEALIQLVRYVDADGRRIGADYGLIRKLVLRRFPTVRRNGPHKGRPTKMPFKELQEFACELNRQGVRLPFRPRRKAKKGPN
jgi:hypothetical protein